MKENLLDNVDSDNFFEEEGMSLMGPMTSFMKLQQQGALDLTRLVLEHCKEKEITKDYVFNIFKEAMSLIQTQLNPEDER